MKDQQVRWAHRRWVSRVGAGALLGLMLSGCGGGSGRDTPEVGSAPACDGHCADTGVALTVDDVQRVLAQAVAEAQAQGKPATIAVSDRVGNILAIYRMTDANENAVVLKSNADGPVDVEGGLEGIVLPGVADTLAAISKAVTGAYLSSEGNAFSTRTAGQIVQEHFNPGEMNQPAGPLFGVQFSQLACSDLTLNDAGGAAGIGPKQSPLGLAADPGGFPLYKNGTVVGGVGVIADGVYGLDRFILDQDRDLDEVIAFAATYGYAAPSERRGDRITVEGKTFRFSDVDAGDLLTNPTAAPAFASLEASVGSLVAIPTYFDGTIRAGTAFGQPASGVRPAGGALADLDAFILVDSTDTPRYAPRAGTDGPDALTEAEVTQLLRSAIEVANRARAQIRRPLGTPARVTVSVVDSNGEVLGILRTRDAPMFGTDVSLQKARTAAFYSNSQAAGVISSLPDAVYLKPDLSPAASVDLETYLTNVREFLGLPNALADGAYAFTDRAGGNLSRPFFPDGILGTNPGPFSKPAGEWSPFSTGFQLDAVYNGIIRHVAFLAGLSPVDVTPGCIGKDAVDPAADVNPGAHIANGMQIFPGSVPVYRGNILVGAVGVSGDGIDQDDMISFLGVHNAGLALNGSINNAPPEMRADQLEPQGVRLRYVQCPQSPFNGSDQQNVCDGK